MDARAFESHELPVRFRAGLERPAKATTTCTFKPAPALKDSLEGMTSGPIEVKIKSPVHEQQFA